MTNAPPPDFCALFREHAALVWRVLRRSGVPAQDLPDLCQEVFIVVLRKLPQFRHEASVRTWICGIALRVASGHRRRRRARALLAARELSHAATPSTPECELSEQRDWHVLGAALGQVPAEQREALVLFALEEMTVHEVAAALGCAHGTAYSRIKAARLKVEAHLKRCAARQPGTRRGESGFSREQAR